MAAESRAMTGTRTRKADVGVGYGGVRASHLSFSVKIVRTEEQLQKAATLRAEAYGRHVPSLGELLQKPEDLDRGKDTIVFIAESKENSEPLGTIRIQTNFSGPISLEESIELPPAHVGRTAAGVSRLAVKAGPKGRMVKLALFKALHRYCLAKQVELLLIGARPPLDQTYLDLGFSDLFEDKQLRPLRSAANVLHRILYFEVFTAERRWHTLSHPLYAFMSEKFHPDIEVFASVNNVWTRPRAHYVPRRTPQFTLLDPVI